jgi:hypothetical protein
MRKFIKKKICVQNIKTVGPGFLTVDLFSFQPNSRDWNPTAIDVTSCVNYLAKEQFLLEDSFAHGLLRVCSFSVYTNLFPYPPLPKKDLRWLLVTRD